MSSRITHSSSSRPSRHTSGPTKSREPVLDKLRYMRGSEPLPGYDALNVEEIVTALREADPATIKKVRCYERKFANRPGVLEEVVRVHHRRLASQPASPAPAYQPMSATSSTSPGGDQPERAVENDRLSSIVCRADEIVRLAMDAIRRQAADRRANRDPRQRRHLRAR